MFFAVTLLIEQCVSLDSPELYLGQTGGSITKPTAKLEDERRYQGSARGGKLHRYSFNLEMVRLSTTGIRECASILYKQVRFHEYKRVWLLYYFTTITNTVGDRGELPRLCAVCYEVPFSCYRVLVFASYTCKSCPDKFHGCVLYAMRPLLHAVAF